jgi:1-acyl-sn-glycerol-3-phosphate acyltransferase
MKTMLAYILTPIYYFTFGALLGIFHVLQWLAWNIRGYAAHKRVVEVLNYLLIKNLLILGNRTHFTGFEKVPKNRPLIIVSNHQSQYDIPPIVWGFRINHPKFISKIELGKGIPSISYNLRHSGSALIDRKNRPQAIREIISLGRRVEENNYAACIFPEGTRSKDGRVKTFKSAGIETLLKSAPSAVVVPFAIQGNHLIQKNGFPLGVGVRASYQVLDPIERDKHTDEEITAKCELAIKIALGQA